LLVRWALEEERRPPAPRGVCVVPAGAQREGAAGLALGQELAAVGVLEADVAAEATLTALPVVVVVRGEDDAQTPVHQGCDAAVELDAGVGGLRGGQEGPVGVDDLTLRRPDARAVGPPRFDDERLAAPAPRQPGAVDVPRGGCLGRRAGGGGRRGRRGHTVLSFMRSGEGAGAGRMPLRRRQYVVASAGAAMPSTGTRPGTR